MKDLNFKEKILPHLIAIVIFLIIVLTFYSPVFLQNKTVRQNDILQSQGSVQEILDFRAQTGEEALWTNSVFSGMPGYLIQVNYSGDFSKTLINIFSLGLSHPAGQTFAALLSFYILLLVFGVRPYLAIAGALAFGLSSFSIISIEAGHNAKGWAIATMPLVISGIHLTFKKEWYLGFILTSLGMVMHFRANHLQVTYYMLFILAIYGLILIIDRFRNHSLTTLGKPIIIILAAGLLAVGTHTGRLWGVYEYSKYSTRGASELATAESPESQGKAGLDRDYVFAWSHSILEPLTLLIPNFFGGASQQELDLDSEFAKELRKNGYSSVQIRQQVKGAPTYWGDLPFTSGSIYAGAIIVFLFMIGSFLVEKKYRYWLVSATILSIVLSWGKNFEFFNYLMFDYFPLYNKFRSVTMAIIIALFCIPFLGFLGLEKLFQDGLTPRTKKVLLYSFALSGGLCLVLFLLAGMFGYSAPVDSQLPPVFAEALQEDRKSMLRSDALRSFFFILISGVVIYFFLQKKIAATLAYIGLAALIILDLWTVDRRYLDDSNYVRDPARESFTLSEADKTIKQDPDLSYRVFDIRNPFNNALTSYHHKSIGGYHGAKMRRYQDLIEKYLSNHRNQVIQNLQTGNFSFSGFPVLNMLNAKYIMFSDQKNGAIQNQQALGNAWLVPEVIKVSSPTEEITRIGEINPGKQAVIDISKFPIGETSYSNQGSVRLTEYQPNYLKYEYTSPEPGLVVFSEVYYPVGWKATIDEEPVDFIRANYILRAMEVPAGEHTIEFYFKPNSYFVGNRVSAIFSLLLFGLLIGAVVQQIRLVRKSE